MDFNPMMAPPPMAGPAASKKGGSTTLYIVLFFLCVISIMAGSFYFMNQSQAAKSARDVEKIQAEAASKMKDATSDFEKQQIQADAAEKTRAAQRKAEFTGKEAALEARAKGKEAQIKALEAKVATELAAAAKTVKAANELRAKAAFERNAAATRLREAQAAKAKADASGKAIDKKLAAEKIKLAKAANKKVAAANKKASAAARKAKAEARKAINLKNALNKVNRKLAGVSAKLAGVNFERAAPYGAVPGYTIGGRTSLGNQFNVTDPNACKALARAKGANVWGHRGINHSSSKWRNSCFFYKTKSGQAKYKGNKNDKIHMIGCTYGGNPKTKCSKNPYKKTSAKNTPDNDWGGGNSIYLDRHTLDCGNDGIQRFQLKRPSGSKIDYKYTCVDGVNASQSGYKYTGSNDWGGGNMIYLDRHKVDCGKKPISRFRLTRPAGNKLRYQFRCSNRNAAGDCRNTATGWNTPSSSTIYLDRHNVKCKANEVLTKFKLRHNGKSGGAKKIRYDYTCCAM